MLHRTERWSAPIRGTTHRSHMQGSNSERRMTGTCRYTRSYIGNGVGSHSFSENIMPANRVRKVYRRWKDREEAELPEEMLWGNMAPEHEATARCRKERMQRKNQNEQWKEKRTRQRNWKKRKQKVEGCRRQVNPMGLGRTSCWGGHMSLRHLTGQ